jgi:phosphatidylglycerol lysyltransferase
LFEPSRTLFNFKQKFHPCWESRYLVSNTRLSLPKIALAVLRLRNSSGDGRDREYDGYDSSSTLPDKQ